MHQQRIEIHPFAFEEENITSKNLEGSGFCILFITLFLNAALLALRSGKKG